VDTTSIMRMSLWWH